MTTISTTTSSNSVYTATGPFIAEEPQPQTQTQSCGAVGAKTPTGKCSANNGASGTKSTQSTTAKNSSGSSAGNAGTTQSGSDFFSDLLGGILNFSGGGGIASLLSNMVPGLGMLMTGLSTIFKSSK